MKTKKNVIIFFALLTVVLNANAQIYSGFKKWNSRIRFDAKEIIIVVDSTSSKMGMEFVMKVADRTKIAISNAGVETRLTTQPDTLIFSFKGPVLAIRFTLNKPAYVFGGFPGTGMWHACNTINFTQIYPNSKRKMNTVLSISVYKEEDAINQLVENLSSEILKTLSKK